MIPVLFDPDASWSGGACRVCGELATGKLLVYVEEQDQHRTVGEAFRHADKGNCVHPPALARSLMDDSTQP